MEGIEDYQTMLLEICPLTRNCEGMKIYLEMYIVFRYKIIENYMSSWCAKFYF